MGRDVLSDGLGAWLDGAAAPFSSAAGGWEIVWAALAGLWLGAVLDRLAQAYAEDLALGAPAAWSTLWTAAWAAHRRRAGLVRTTGAALLLSLTAGLCAAACGPAYALLGLVLVVLAAIDARSGLLPDALTLPLMVSGWLLGAQTVGVAVLVSVLTWASLGAVVCLYRWVRGRDGFGGGDIKCMAALAGWLGPGAACMILWLACVLGVAVALVRRHHWSRPCPFGPCIALAALAWLLLPMAARLAVQS